MKSPSIDSIYTILNKHILLVESYTEINNLSFIIKSCRLKPYNYLLNHKEDLILHEWWVDEFGNSLKIKNKKIKIIVNDLEIDRKKIICTDLYYGLSIEKISKISKLAHLFSGKEDSLQDFFVTTFLGIDNYLRTYMYDEGWQQISSLMLGLSNLKKIARHIDIQYFLELDNKENIIAPCTQAAQWITFMPPSKEFLTLLEKQYEIVLPIFKLT